MPVRLLHNLPNGFVRLGFAQRQPQQVGF